jgi:hypothetical protein
MAKKREIRNSTAEFLIFQAENKEQGIKVMYADETIWCTQDAIAALFDKGRSTIAEHLQNAFSTGELEKDSVCRNSDELPLMARSTIRNIIISMRLLALAIV